MAKVRAAGAGEAQPPASPDREPAQNRRAPLLRGRRRRFITVAAAVVVLGGGALAASLLTAGSSGRVVSGNVVEYTVGHQPLAPDITGTSLTGATIRLSSYRGKVLVLNFWASWCPPCREEAPTLKVASQLYRSQGVDFLGDDVGDTPTTALAFTRSKGISYPSISDPGYSVAQQFSQAAQVSALPTTAVIDKTGHVVATVFGAISNTELATLLHEAAAA